MNSLPMEVLASLPAGQETCRRIALEGIGMGVLGRHVMRPK
jgi:hypothetical protein